MKMNDKKKSIDNITDFEYYQKNGFSRIYSLHMCSQALNLAGEFKKVLQVKGIAPEPDKEDIKGRLASLIESGAESPVPYIECRHLDNPLVLKLCNDQKIKDIIRQIYGDDILLWRTTIVKKGIASTEFSWHQDFGGKYSPGEFEYGLEPPFFFTVCIAITKADNSNGGLVFAPGIKKLLPGKPSNEGKNATELIDMDKFKLGETVEINMKPGEFFMFSDRAPHFSPPNKSSEERVYLFMRCTVPFVKIRNHFSNQKILILSGEDKMGINNSIQLESYLENIA